MSVRVFLAQRHLVRLGLDQTFYAQRIDVLFIHIRIIQIITRVGLGVALFIRGGKQYLKFDFSRLCHNSKIYYNNKTKFFD